jgi:hypothetical protein
MRHASCKPVSVAYCIQYGCTDSARTHNCLKTTIVADIVADIDAEPCTLAVLEFAKFKWSPPSRP